MKRLFIFKFILLFNLIFAQKIGFVNNFDPNLKHIHLKGMWNYHVDNIEDLNYDITPFIDGLFQENKIEPIKFDDFDFSLFNTGASQKKREEYLHNYCLEKGIDNIIIMWSSNFYHSLDPLKTINGNYSYAILSHKNSKKRMLYANRISFLHYSLKDNKLKSYSGYGKESLFYSSTGFKVDNTIFDNTTKTLIEKDKHTQNFLEDLHRRMKLNFNLIIEDIRK